MPFWTWLTQSTSGLLLRIAVGVAIFAALAVHDLYKNRDRATRWREYTFLVACVLAAMIYGVISDSITSGLSWEYFYYGKGLASDLGPTTPPDPRQLHFAAAIVGIKATWSAGLLIGVAILLSNNPSKFLPRLRNRQLLRQLPLVLALAISFAAIGALSGYFALPAKWNDDFAEMLRKSELRPRRFMMTYGIHLGGYIGGGIGAILAIIRVRRQRSSMIDTPRESPV